MPTESVVFAPEIDERELDKTVDDTNESFSEAATDLPVSVDDRSIDGFEEDLQNAADDVVADIEAEMDAMTPGGGSGGVLAGGALGAAAGGGGAPALPSGAAAGGGAAAMAAKIPKPIAGVTAAAAMPVALAGGIGAGMLSAMTSASARLQTSNSMLHTAWTKIWQAPGDLLDKHIVRPFAQGLLEDALNFDELFRKGKFGQAIEALATGRDPRQTDKLTRIIGNAGAGLGLVGGGLAGAKAGGALGATVGSIGGPLGTAIGGTAGGIGGALVGAIAGTGIGGRIASAIGEKIPDIPTPELPEIPEFSWPSLPSFSWPDLPDFGWPDIPDFGWPDLPDFSWPSLPSFNWPSLPNFSWPDIDLPDVPNWSSLVPKLPDWSNLVPKGVPNFDPDTDPLTPGNQDINLPFGMARGGVVRKPTPVMAGEAGPEVISPVSEFRRMIQGAMQQGTGSGGGGQEVDMSRVESKLDDLNRNIKALRSAFDVSVEVDSEEIARASKNGEQNRIGDTNPSV